MPSFPFSRLSFRRSALFTCVLSLALTLPQVAKSQQLVFWGQSMGGALKPPSGLKGVVQIAAGHNHALALLANGSVVGWGLDHHGESTPPSGLNGVVQIAAGWSESIALKSDGTVVSWPSYPAPVGLKDVVQVAVSVTHCLALKSDGTVVAWGDNTLGAVSVPRGLSDVVHVSCDSDSSFAVRSNGSVVFWGNSWDGTMYPPDFSDVVRVTPGSQFAYAIKANGGWVGWGADAASFYPIPAGLTGIRDIVQTGALTLMTDGTVLTWANDPAGQWTPPAGLTNVSQLVRGDTWSLALRPPVWSQIDQTVIYSGASATGTITLAEAAGTEGQTVGLNSSDPAVKVPATVRVVAGARTATFPVSTTLYFGADRDISVGAKTDGVQTSDIRFRLKGQSVALATNTTSFVGGSTTNPLLTLTLGWSALAGTTLHLSSSDPALSLPSTVEFSPGQSTMRVPLTHRLTSEDRPVGLKVAYSGTQIASTSVNLRALTGALSLSAPRIEAGSSVSGLLRIGSTLKSSLTIPLKSDYGHLAVPPTVTIPAGSREATFSVTAKETATNKAATVTATINGKAVAVPLKVEAKPEVTAIELTSPLIGCSRTLGKVRLKYAAPVGGTTVNLASGDISVLRVPAKVTIPEGKYSVDFEVVTMDVAANASATITATVGTSVKTVQAQAVPITIASFSIPSSVKGGGTVTATVTLSAAVSTGRSIAITASDRNLASFPTSVLVPTGARSVTFQIVTKKTAVQKTLTVTASKNGTVSKTLKITP